MKITRTDVFANVSYEKYTTESGKLVKDTHEARLPKCRSEEKAIVLLQKENKGALIQILSCTFDKVTYAMDADFFYHNAEVVNEETNVSSVTEE